MIEFDNRTSHDINFIILNSISKSLTKKDIELIITDNKEIKEMNKLYRNIDSDTDVLSFPYEDMPMSLLGSIVISYSHVKSKAQELKHKESDELSLLFIHGLLHLLGYDHEIDDGEMREKESKLIQKFNLPKSLIIRTQG
ncbi:MAG: rRNA maturation RNase YbeY [Sulfurimonas sp.]|nr:rRNA maturation RNase YbeY [Sulfurimonas sp.]